MVYFKPNRDDIVIVIMGPTGSGKTNLINKITGNVEQRKASNLKPDTQSVTPYPVLFQGSRVVVVDTPGFDDAHWLDGEILRTIANWLTQKYPDGTALKIVGIIYVHRISDNRMSGSAYKNLQLFGRLCGNIPLSRTRLVTTMWDQVRNQGVARQRETQLKNESWRPLIDEGATVHQFHNTSASALQIVASLSQTEGGGLLLQEELVEPKKRLNETETGKTVYSRLEKLLVDQRNILKELANEAKLQNNDPALMKSLQEECEKVDAQLQIVFELMGEMKIPPFRRIILWLFGRKSHARVVKLDYQRA